jgi:hypothetical protein
MNKLFFVEVAGAIVFTYLAFASMWLQYLAVMNLKEHRSKLTLAAKLWAYPMLIVGIFSDFLFNLVIGTIVYIELPKQLLFTSRCNLHLRDTNWRGSVARWFCRNFMDPFDPDGKHCSGRGE